MCLTRLPGSYLCRARRTTLSLCLVNSVALAPSNGAMHFKQFIQLHWLPVMEQCILNNLKFQMSTYIIVNGLIAPSYLNDLFIVPYTPRRAFRSRDKLPSSVVNRHIASQSRMDLERVWFAPQPMEQIADGH